MRLTVRFAGLSFIITGLFSPLVGSPLIGAADYFRFDVGSQSDVALGILAGGMVALATAIGYSSFGCVVACTPSASIVYHLKQIVRPSIPESMFTDWGFHVMLAGSALLLLSYRKHEL